MNTPTFREFLDFFAAGELLTKPDYHFNGITKSFNKSDYFVMVSIENLSTILSGLILTHGNIFDLEENLTNIFNNILEIGVDRYIETEGELELATKDNAEEAVAFSFNRPQLMLIYFDLWRIFKS